MTQPQHEHRLLLEPVYNDLRRRWWCPICARFMDDEPQQPERGGGLFEGMENTEGKE